MKARLSITALALLFLSAVACAQLTPTPEPPPPATLDIPAMVATQVAERMVDIPTATPYPTYTPNPTPTLLPTYTPYPTPTNTPQPVAAASDIRWKSVSPRDYYTLEVPADWFLEYDDPETWDFRGAVDYGIYDAGVYIYDAYSSSGWDPDFTAEKLVEQDLESARETWPGLRVLSVVASSSGEHRTEISFPSTDEFCSGLAYGRHILTPVYYYTLWVEVCDGLHEVYDAEFAGWLLSSFTYR